MTSPIEEDYSQATCDGKGCGAALVPAKVITALPNGGVLTWCRHHSRRHREAIEEMGGIAFDLGTAE